MTDKEVLEKAIKIAIENGMSPEVIDKGTFFQIYWATRGRGVDQMKAIDISMEDCYGVIFSHDFAKAFWPAKHTGLKYDQGTCESCDAHQEDYGNSFFSQTCWKQHLAFMVLEENPIDYLRKFI